MPSLTASELEKIKQQKSIYANIFYQQELYAIGVIPQIRYQNTSHLDNSLVLTGFTGGGIKLNDTSPTNSSELAEISTIVTNLKTRYTPSLQIRAIDLTVSMKYSAQFTAANNSYLSVPGSSAFTLGTNNHTIEFWMNQTSRGDYDCPFNYNNGGVLQATNNYYLNVGLQQFRLLLGSGGGFAINLDCGTRPSLNAWHHYAIVRNGNVFTVYVDGTSVANVTSSASIAAQGATTLGIGAQFVNGSYFATTGYITNFRFVNGTAVYTSNFTPSTVPLVAISGTQLLLQGLIDTNSPPKTITNNGNVTLSTTQSPFA
jgi:hypothetical protein